MATTKYVVRLKESDGFRDVKFDDRDAAMRFREMAEDDGTYWGFHEQWIPGPEDEPNA